MTTIVVGIDGSSGSSAALAWAVHEGDVRGAEVRAVMAWNWLDQGDLGAPGFSPQYDEQDARRVLDEVVVASVGDAPVERVVVCDLAVPTLRDAAVGADLLVVGARGNGGFAGLRMGSVSERLLEVSPCPLAVVREGAVEHAGPVVVGIDGSATSRAALDWAIAEAAAREAGLDIVHSWTIPATAASPYIGALPDLRYFEETARKLVDDAVTTASKAGVVATSHLSRNGGARFLLERADKASVVVVGSRGHGRVMGALLGSVSRQVAHHASCPVVVVRT